MKVMCQGRTCCPTASLCVPETNVCVLLDRKPRCKMTMHLLTMPQHWPDTHTVTTRCTTHRATVEATATINAGPAGPCEAVVTTAAVSVSIAEGCVRVQDPCEQSDTLFSQLCPCFGLPSSKKDPCCTCVTVSGPAVAWSMSGLMTHSRVSD